MASVFHEVSIRCPIGFLRLDQKQRRVRFVGPDEAGKTYWEVGALEK